MSTTKEYLSFILEQLSVIDGITHRQMMGEYIIYHHGKVAAYICNNSLLVKPVPSAVKLMPNASYEALYEGAKKKTLLCDNVDDSEFLKTLFEAMYEELPEPKKRKK